MIERHYGHLVRDDAEQALAAYEQAIELGQPGGVEAADGAGVHVTGSKLDSGKPAGSIAVLVSRVSGRPLRLFRFGDTPSGRIDLAAAREVT